MRPKQISVLIVFALAVCMLITLACQVKEPVRPNPSQQDNETIPSLAKSAINSGGLKEAVVSPFLGQLNKKLQMKAANLRIALAEWITTADQIGRTVYFKDIGNKQLESFWVPGDPNRDGRKNITWLVDKTELGTGLSNTDTYNAIDRAMTTWDNVKCSAIPLEEVPDYGLNWGYVQWLEGMGGVPGWYADITHAGWLPGAFFDHLEAGGSDYIIAVTFTFIWVSGGTPTDMDGNKKMDVAFREIYYNAKFPWGINTSWPIDVETIALHEVGHGLSQAHFGTAFRSPGNGELHFSPLAVMNAGYSGIQQALTASDLAGHCSIWATWPMK